VNEDTWQPWPSDPTVRVHRRAELAVDALYIGPDSVIGPDVVIEGRRVRIGREAWLDRGAYIGGGSCHDPWAELQVGDWLHMGRHSHINIARPVMIGHEFGCGIETKVFAHGAYLAATDGFPVQFGGVTIGDRVWLPNAWVNPGVTIGSDVVVAARSLVNRDLPAHCLAGGIPAKVLRENCYPRALTYAETRRILQQVLYEALAIHGHEVACSIGEHAGEAIIKAEHTLFMIGQRVISGPASPFSAVLKNQLRRYGIRFRYAAVDGQWQPWSET